MRSVSGGSRKEQVEMHSEGWDDPRERKGLSICQMHRVGVAFVSCRYSPLITRSKQGV